MVKWIERPWLTDEAVGLLDRFCQLNPDARIVEYGAGGSTIWFARRTCNLLTFEHRVAWYRRVRRALVHHELEDQVDFRLTRQPWEHVLLLPDESIDLVIVDGLRRGKCTTSVLGKLKPGGVLTLDNASRPKYRSIHRLLDGWGWQKHDTKQTGRDQYGKLHLDWHTTFWMKP